MYLKTGMMSPNINWVHDSKLLNAEVGLQNESNARFTRLKMQ